MPRKINHMKNERYGLNGNLVNKNERAVEKGTKMIKENNPNSKRHHSQI